MLHSEFLLTHINFGFLYYRFLSFLLSLVIILVHQSFKITFKFI